MPDSRSLVIRRIVPVALLSLLVACGGGGGGGAPPPLTPIALTMGLVASTAPTRRTVTIPNDANSVATVTAGPAAGPFTLDPADLPLLIPAHSTSPLGVLFTPTGTGDAAGTAAVEVDAGGGNVIEIPVEATATAESVVWTVTTPALAFGEVLLGTTRTLVAHAHNNATVSPGPLTGATFPAGGFAVVGTPLPTMIAPGADATISVSYTPTSVGAFTGSMLIGATGVATPLAVVVSGTTGGPVVTSYGTRTLDASLRTSVLTVDVPADAISLSLEGVMTPGSAAGLAELTGPSGKVYENTSGTGAYIWIPGDEVFSPTLPNTDHTDVQLEPGGGTYSFRLYRYSGTATTIKVRAIVERRPGNTGSVGNLDLDVWLAKVITPKAATAATDTRLQATLSAIDAILAQAGIHLGDIRYHDVTDPTYDDVTDPEFGPMLQLTSAVTTPRLNLFFVRTALGGGVLGVAATLAGPRINGTQLSGVMSLYDGGYTSNFIGLVSAHEIGHFLGLYHTAESNGANDFINDTNNCPATGTNAGCLTSGGGYLMHWQAVGGSNLSAAQRMVIRGHPCVDATLLPPAPLVAASFAPEFDLRAGIDQASLLEGGSTTWCATCARCRLPKGK